MRSITEKITIYSILSLIVIGCGPTNDNAKDFGISIRQEPLRDFITNKIVRVSDFGEQVGAGVYLYQLRANQYVKTRKMVLLK